MRSTLLALATLAGCGRDPAPSPPPRPTEEKPVPSDDLTIAQQWDGPIHVEAGAPAVSALVIRDDAAYDAFIARLPTERVQLKRPAPPSDDPMLDRPAIDFAVDMLVVVIRADTLERPAFARITRDDGKLVVTHISPPPPPAAMPSGVGAYAAARVPRADGELVLVAPPVIEREADLAAAVGTLVTVRGELHRSKIPTILGVDVDEGTASPGQRAEATGWLESSTVTQAELDAEIAEHGQFAHRGPGTFHHLVAPNRQGLAPATRIY